MNATQLAMNTDNVVRAMIIEELSVRPQQSFMIQSSKSGAMGFWDTPRMNVRVQVQREADGTVSYTGSATVRETNFWDTTNAEGEVSGNFDPRDRDELTRLVKFAIYPGRECWRFY